MHFIALPHEQSFSHYQMHVSKHHVPNQHAVHAESGALLVSGCFFALLAVTALHVIRTLTIHLVLRTVPGPAMGSNVSMLHVISGRRIQVQMHQDEERPILYSSLTDVVQQAGNAGPC